MKTITYNTYLEAVNDFKWSIPPHLNMAEQVCDRWADTDPNRVAIIEAFDPDHPQDIPYADLRAMADGLAWHLLDMGVQQGDRVGVLRSQSAWTAAAHIAIWKLGAISIPLFKLFGPDALATRLQDSDTRIVITDPQGHRGLENATWDCVVPETLNFGKRRFDTVQTQSQDPAVLIYTSGTTGAPKGALHAHRVLTGHLPGVEMSHNGLGHAGDCLWTPADWAWIGGLFDVLMPGLALGVPVVAARADKFSPSYCHDVLSKLPIKNVFFPPTALRMLKAHEFSAQGLRTVGSGGEPLGAEMLAWGRRALGVDINEFYGQTECNMVASSASFWFDPKPGCIGKAVPGFELAVLDQDGHPSLDEGDVAIRKGAASMMLGYWNKPEQTQAKFKGDWMLTGDRGIWDGDYLRFVGREDDVITSAGYRIGPSEIEDCILQHAAVATVGVVGKPDPLRTEIVKAYVVLKPDFLPNDDLRDDIINHVKQKLTLYSYPRELAFLDALPMTVTGKVIRKDLRARAIRETETTS